jgi:hypothetical protein
VLRALAIRKLKHAEAPWLINNYGEVFNQNDEDVRLTFDLSAPENEAACAAV